jgi:hypothetical protein
MDKQRIEQFISALPPMIKLPLKMLIPKISDDDLADMSVDMQIIRNSVIIVNRDAMYYIMSKYNVDKYIPEIYDMIDSLCVKDELEGTSVSDESS